MHRIVVGVHMSESSGVLARLRQEAERLRGVRDDAEKQLREIELLMSLVEKYGHLVIQPGRPGYAADGGVDVVLTGGGLRASALQIKNFKLKQYGHLSNNSGAPLLRPQGSPAWEAVLHHLDMDDPPPPTMRERITNTCALILADGRFRTTRLLVRELHDRFGVVVSGKDPVANLASYLSHDDRFVSSKRHGGWSLRQLSIEGRPDGDASGLMSDASVDGSP